MRPLVSASRPTGVAVTDLEQLRDRAIDELRQAAGPLLSGTLAMRLGVATHRVQLALNAPLQRGELHFSTEGWSLPEPDRRPAFDDAQSRLDG